MIASVRMKKERISDQTFLFQGAGEVSSAFDYCYSIDIAVVDFYMLLLNKLLLSTSGIEYCVKL